MNRHTPAPWEVIYTPKGYVSRIRSSDAARAKKPGACYDITRHNGFAMPASEEGKANARLISSAPTMYEFVASKAASGDTEAIAIMGKINGNA